MVGLQIALFRQLLEPRKGFFPPVILAELAEDPWP